MSRLKRCAYDNVLDDYEELANYKSCRNCKHFCATQKVPCQQRFLWHFYQSDEPTGEFWARLGAKPRLRMIAKCYILFEKMHVREVVKQAIADYGYLPTRKQIYADKEAEYAMEREWAYLETWDCHS